MLYLFDVDRTLRRSILLPPVGSLAAWDQRILPGRAERLQALRQVGHHVAAVTNQAAVAFGLISEARAQRSLAELNRRLNGAVEWIRMCPHHPRALVPRYRLTCACRKPASGMLTEALAHFQVPPGQAIFIGDREIDRQAAQGAGVAFTWADAFFR